MVHELMAYINVNMQDRPAGRPASAESVERERLLASKAEAIAKLKAMRVASQVPRVASEAEVQFARKKRGRPPKMKV